MSAKCSLLIMLGCLLLMTPSAAYGQKYGLLLGFAPGSAVDVVGQANASDPSLQPGPMAGYATVWVTVDGSDVNWSILRDIIIPRRDGFWRLGGDLALAKTEHESVVEVFLWADPISVQHQPGKPEEPRCSEFSYFQGPTWINPDYVGVSAFRSASCSHYDENSDAYVLKLDDLRVARSADNLPRPLGLAAMLGASAVQEAKRAARRASRSTKGEYDCGDWIASDQAWHVMHHEGKWIGLAQLGREGPGICDRLSTEVTITSSELERLARRKLLPISFASVQKQVPSARDIVFSPDGKIAVVVLAIGSVEVRKLQAGHLSESLASIDLQPYRVEPDVVMTEWALAPHVADWGRQMQSLPKLEPRKEDEP